MAPILIRRGEGSNSAERRLKQLCDRSFLRFWSYPGLYRNQGKTEDGGDGKEICDLLVVFENHLLIFSDKDCVFPDTGNLGLDWSRWFRRAVQKPAEQVWGAERWLLTHPNRIFLDRSCRIPFPLTLPDSAVAKVHRIVVTHNASDRCVREFGGTGSLMIRPELIGDMHYESSNAFSIGQIDPLKGFVHVFDDTTLNAVMSVLDTITDFTEYLTKKERFINSGNLHWAAGEDDLLGFYLQTVNSKGEHDFITPDGAAVAILEGFWKQFSESPERKAQIEANEISYAWDALIEKFSLPFFEETANDSYFLNACPNHMSLALRFLARESRAQRFLLASVLEDFAREEPKRPRGARKYPIAKATRTIVPKNPGDPYYVLLKFSRRRRYPISTISLGASRAAGTLLRKNKA